MTRHGGRTGERGSSVAVEAALLIPAFLLMIGVIVYLAGAELARQAVGGAAGDAARAASLARSATEAKKIAQQRATDSLAERNVECHEPVVTVDTSRMMVPRGQVGAVTVSVRCRVSLEQVAVPPLPGSFTITVDRSAPIDAFRSR